MLELGSQVPLAFAAGLLSVLSPCVLPLLPAYLSLISGITVEELEEASGEGPLRARVMRACAGFVLGFSGVFVALGVGAVSFGHVVRTWHVDVFGLEIGLAQIMGGVVVLFGLHLLGLTPVRLLMRDTRFHPNVHHHGFASSALVGTAFALGWSPCIGPILGSILGLAAVRESALEGAALLTIYSAGLAVPFLLAGWSVEAFFEAFSRLRGYVRIFERVAGVALVGVGGLLMTDQFTRLNANFTFMSDWITAIERALQ